MAGSPAAARPPIATLPRATAPPRATTLPPAKGMTRELGNGCPRVQPGDAGRVAGARLPGPGMAPEPPVAARGGRCGHRAARRAPAHVLRHDRNIRCRGPAAGLRGHLRPAPPLLPVPDVLQPR